MLCVGVSKIRTKAGEDRILVTGLSHRANTDGVSASAIWLTPAEYSHDPVEPGDTFQAFRDGGIMIFDKKVFDMSVFSSIF